MFHQTIRNGRCTLINNDFDLFFEDKIDGPAVNNDRSFVATLRGLLGKKLEEGESFMFEPSEIRHAEDIDLIRPLHNTLQLVYFRSGTDAEALLTKAHAHMESFDGYAHIEKVAQYYGAAFKAYAWSNKDDCSAIILTGSMDSRKLHILQACIPIVLPWYFSGKDGKLNVTAEERALLSTLDKTDEKEYLAAISKLAAQYDIKEFIVRRRLDGITKQFHEIQLRNEQAEIDRCAERVHDLYNEIEELLKDRDRHMTLVYGLKARLKEKEGGSELTDYFISNKSLELYDVEGTRISFTSKGYLEFWDDDTAETVIENDDAYPYDIADRNGISTSGLKRLLRAIFLDKTIRIRSYADYTIDLSGHVEAASFSHGAELADHLPNPHIAAYDCLGDYRRRILECLSSGNTLAAFEYCVASSKSLNWGDGTVMERFFRWICNEYDGTRCFELPDGTCVTIGEAIKWASEN